MDATIVTALAVLFSTNVYVLSVSPMLGSGDGPSPKDVGGEPLFLTPLIEEGQVIQARNLSRVHAESLGMNLESYSGFLTVRPEDEAHLFFWFFPALETPETAPVILWMNGGPGLTSLSGLFAEIGPYYVTNDGKVERMDVTWISKFNVIFLDAPVGTGFSFPTLKTSYSNNTEEIARDIQEALRQFFLVFTDYGKLDFYAAGESYAGKYVVSLAHAMAMSSKASPINLKGIVIVSGFYDPYNMINTPDYAYQLGLIQKTMYDEQSVGIILATALMDCRQYVSASRLLAAAIGFSDHQAYRPSSFKEESGIAGSNNALRDQPQSKYKTFIPFVNNTRQLRRALHVGDATPFVEMNSEVMSVLIASGDFANSTRSQLEASLDVGTIKVLFVTGNMDYIIVPVGAEKAVQALEWKCQDEYVNRANRTIWRVNVDDVDSAGYVKCACNFCHVLVRDAGHRLPGDEPVRVLDIVDRFINKRPY